MTTPRMLAAATALATVLSGCGAGTVTGTATTPVRSVATAAAEQEADLADRLRHRPSPLRGVDDGGADLATAQRLGMDPARAAAAARRGYPFVATVNGDGRDCPMLLRLPTGALWWSPPMVTITGAGMAMTMLAADASAVPGSCVTPSGPPASGPVDAAGVAAAASEGRPWISAFGGDAVDGCHVDIRLPGTAEALGLDTHTAGKDGGGLVDGSSLMFACAWR